MTDPPTTDPPTTDPPTTDPPTTDPPTTDLPTDSSGISPPGQPDFIGLGAERAATTWLHECLAAHPDAFVPPGKEVHYFSHCLGRGESWYLSHFADAPPKAVSGEISPSYLHDADLSEVRALIPSAKFVVILREPLARTRSAYQLYFGDKPEVSFPQAIERNRHLVTRSLYADALAKWFEAFGRESVGVWLYDDVVADPPGTFSAVCRHLGIRDDFTPTAAGKTYNRVLFPRLQSVFYAAGLGWAVSLIGDSPVGEAIKKASRRRGAASTFVPPAELRRELCAVFRPDIDRLEPLLGRNLSAWRNALDSADPDYVHDAHSAQSPLHAVEEKTFSDSEAAAPGPIPQSDNTETD